MSSVLEVKMINEGDDLRIVVPKSYFQRLGLERGDTLLVTVEEERTSARRKNGKTRVHRAHKHN
jgi:bifunctional DNA-binding transcriptional regulator/antitoxin component of YhaV-PrlF toxin-antitoxin module